jgi:hypothetical protein
MICCRDLVEHLLDYDSGTLTPELRLEIDEHLVRCASCVCYLESYRLTVRLTRQLPPTPLPAALESRLQQILASKTPSSAPPAP